MLVNLRVCHGPVLHWELEDVFDQALVVMLLEMMMIQLERMVLTLLILEIVGMEDVQVLMAASNCSLIFLDRWRFSMSPISGKMTSGPVM